MRASLLLIAALLVAGCGGPAATIAPTAAPTAEVYTLTGTFTLKSSSNAGSNLDCHGTGGFDDIKGGLDVVVRDQSHTILAASTLGPGKKNVGATECAFAFTVPNVPRATFYSVAVGHRGELTYSFAEMVSNGWVVAFTLS